MSRMEIASELFLEIFGNFLIFWKCLNILEMLEILEHFGNVGTFWKCWNILEMLEHFGNVGTFWNILELFFTTCAGMSMSLNSPMPIHSAVGNTTFLHSHCQHVCLY
jgi:hypothetical protein